MEEIKIKSKVWWKTTEECKTWEGPELMYGLVFYLFKDLIVCVLNSLSKYFLGPSIS